MKHEVGSSTSMPMLLGDKNIKNEPGVFEQPALKSSFSVQAFAIRSQLEQTTSRAVSMHLLTDSKSVFDIISKGSGTSEKRVMLDVHAAPQTYCNQEISNIGFAKSTANIAD